MKTYDNLLIGMRWVKPSSTQRYVIKSPATGEVVGETAEAAVADVDTAVAEARKAFDTGPWPRMSLAERLGVMTAARDYLAARTDELDTLATQENGISVAVEPGASAVAVLDFYLGAAKQYAFEEDRDGVFGCHGTILREPVGVVAAITPWNGSLLQPMAKLAPALAAGCTVVLKPAQETPLTSIAIAEAFLAAGLPEGVLSVLPGGRDIGRHLVSHLDVDKVSFTGSTTAGKEIATICGAAVRRVSLELGGKSAAVVLDDADVAMTSTFVSLGCMALSGQACAALTRAVVPRSRYKEFVDGFCKAIGALQVGDPMDHKTIIGPLVAERQLRRVESYIASGLEQGARLALGGHRIADRPEGWYIQPTIFIDVTNDMRIAREEIFGPVLSVIPYDTEEEAIAIANDTAYGLSAAVFGSTPDRVRAVARRLRGGSIGLNAIPGDVGLPFGGFKSSGIGREYSIEAFDHFTEIKTLSHRDAVSFGPLDLETA